MKSKKLDYINFEEVNSLLEGFNKTTGFVTAIFDLEGNVISKSGRRSICVEFHRVNHETSRNCSISDTVLSNEISKGEKYHFYKCLNGLVRRSGSHCNKRRACSELILGTILF